MTSQANLIELNAPGRSVHWRYLPLVLFCLGHFFIDLYSMALGALQPLLVDKFSLSLTQAGFLAGTLVFSSSLMQPLYGYLSDRFHTFLFAGLAPAVAAIFISSLGVAPNYAALMAMVWLGGAGVAAFHPQATSHATLGIDSGRGRAMAIFISSGTLGLAVGPSYFSWIAGRLGFERTWWGAVPGVIVSVLLVIALRRTVVHSRPKVKYDFGAMREVRRPLAILFFLVVIRSVVQVTFAQFLPLYLHLQRGYAVSTASYITSAYLVGGAIGGFAGGNLADRWGGRRVIILSMILSVPFLLVFVLATGFWSIAGLVAGGLILLFTIPVNVMMGQELLPSQAGTVSAMMMGFAWGMAGMIFIPLTGWISDTYSMQHAFVGLVVIPLAGFFLALKLPK